MPDATWKACERKVAARLCDGAQSGRGLVRLLNLPCGDFRPRRMEGTSWTTA